MRTLIDGNIVGICIVIDLQCFRVAYASNLRCRVFVILELAGWWRCL